MTIEQREDAVYGFHCALVSIQAQTIQRLMACDMPPEFYPVCTGASPMTCEYIVQDLRGELEEPAEG